MADSIRLRFEVTVGANMSTATLIWLYNTQGYHRGCAEMSAVDSTVRVLVASCHRTQRKRNREVEYSGDAGDDV
jgi:hypothetical protein